MSRLARSVTITLAARLGALAVSVVASVILARALGPLGRGEYALIVLIPALIQFGGGFGLDQATTYLVARRREEAAAIGLTLAGAAALLGLLLVALYAALSVIPAYTHYLERAGAEARLVWVLIALLPISLPTTVLTGAILGLERFRSYNLVTLVWPVVNLGLLLGLVVILNRGVGGAVLASAGASVLSLVTAAATLFYLAPERKSWKSEVVKEACSYGARAHAANLAWLIHYRADMLLVGYMAGPAALGFYAVAVGVAEKLYLAPSAVGTVIFPRIAATSPAEARRLTPRAVRHSLWLTLVLALLIAAVARPLVRGLFGASFVPAVIPLWLLLPGVVSLAMGRVLSADLNGRGLPGVVARANASMAVLNLLLNLWWIPLWGIAGAAVATSISYSAAVMLLARRYVRLAEVRWSELFRFTRDDWGGLKRAAGALGGGRTPVSEESGA